LTLCAVHVAQTEMCSVVSRVALNPRLKCPCRSPLPQLHSNSTRR
jgi:hypothetical protein